jgi:hypothetical protein
VFNNFDCKAKANFEQISPNIEECSIITVKNKISSEWKNKVFSIIQIPLNGICSCIKALDKINKEDNSNIFFAQIARYEINEMYEKSRVGSWRGNICPVSSLPLIKPAMRISRSRLS